MTGEEQQNAIKRFIEYLEQRLAKESDSEMRATIERLLPELKKGGIIMELETYIEKYLGTLYLQHRAKMAEPVNEKELVARVKEGVAEDTHIELAIDEVERLINEHVPASWRSLSPSEADAQWLSEVRRKEETL